MKQQSTTAALPVYHNVYIFIVLEKPKEVEGGGVVVIIFNKTIKLEI